MLHVADPTIGHAGLHLLSALWHATEAEQHLLLLGHYDGIAVATLAGIPTDRIHWHRALAQYDPATYCGIAKMAKAMAPHAIGLWGNWAQHVGCMAARRVPLCIDFIPPSQPYAAPGFYTHWFIAGRRAAVGFDRGEALICGSTPVRYCEQAWCGVQSQDHFAKVCTTDKTDTLDATSELKSATEVGLPAIRDGDRAEPDEPAAGIGPKILIVAGTGSAMRVDIALWAAAIASQIEPSSSVYLSLPTGHWGVDIERRKRIMEFIGDLSTEVKIAIQPESTPWWAMASQADACVLAADGPVILAPILTAAAMGTPVVATATAQIQSAQPLPGLAATAPPNNPRLLATAIIDVLRNYPHRREEVIQAACDDQNRRRKQLSELVTTLLA